MSNKNKVVDSWLIGLSSVLLAIGGILLIFTWNRLPPQVPWLYSLPWGEGQLVSKWWFGGSLLAIGAVNSVNWILAMRLCQREMVAARVVEGATLLLTAIYLASFTRVISMMTR